MMCFWNYKFEEFYLKKRYIQILKYYLASSKLYCFTEFSGAVKLLKYFSRVQINPFSFF